MTGGEPPLYVGRHSFGGERCFGKTQQSHQDHFVILVSLGWFCFFVWRVIWAWWGYIQTFIPSFASEICKRYGTKSVNDGDERECVHNENTEQKIVSSKWCFYSTSLIWVQPSLMYGGKLSSLKIKYSITLCKRRCKWLWEILQRIVKIFFFINTKIYYNNLEPLDEKTRCIVNSNSKAW